MKLTNHIIKRILGTYNSSDRNTILKNANLDDFNKDVLDGLTNSELVSSDFEKLDRNYYSKPFFLSSLWPVLGLLSILGISVFFIYNPKNNDHEKQNNKPTKSNLKIENSNQNLKLNNNTTKEFKNNNKSAKTPKNIINDPKIELNNHSNINETSNSKNTNNDLSVIKALPIDNNIFNENNTQSFVGKQGAEVYILDYKTLDYRKYRKKPEKKPDPLNLTNGTPANSIEKQHNESENQEIEYNYFDYLKETMKLFDNKLFQLALANFKLILETYPEDVNALFYGGLSHYEQGKFKESIIFFDQVRKSSFINFHEESEWFLLQSYLEINELEKAKTVRKEIINRNGFYAKRASEVILK